MLLAESFQVGAPLGGRAAIAALNEPGPLRFLAPMLGISLDAAAHLLGIPTAAEGGRAYQDRPMLVGERGPESAAEEV